MALVWQLHCVTRVACEMSARVAFAMECETKEISNTLRLKRAVLGFLPLLAMQQLLLLSKDMRALLTGYVGLLQRQRQQRRRQRSQRRAAGGRAVPARRCLHSHARLACGRARVCCPARLAAPLRFLSACAWGCSVQWVYLTLGVVRALWMWRVCGQFSPSRLTQ